MIIDFHSHILPGIDDGSRDAAMTEKMLAASAAQGVEIMAATPHFYADANTVERFLRKRAEAVEKILDLAAAQGIGVIAGAEVAFFDGISRAADVSKLTLGGSRLLLVEMPFRQWGRREVEETERLLAHGFQVIIAHMERYTGLQSDKGPWRAVLELPVLVQLNAECFLSFSTRGKNLRLLKRGEAHLLGSDCHNVTGRPQDLAEGRAVIAKRLGEERLEEIDRLGERLIRRGGAEIL